MKLSFPSKMPCASVGLPAIVACRTGAKLAQVPGSVCSGCYAMKGNYRFSNVKTPRESNGSTSMRPLRLLLLSLRRFVRIAGSPTHPDFLTIHSH
jgi:hypothetical protein